MGQRIVPSYLHHRALREPFFLALPSRNHLYMFVGNGRQAFVLFMLVVKVVESTGVLSLKNSYKPRQIFPSGVDVYDCNTQIQKRGYSNSLVGVSFRVSPNNKTGCFYLRR